MENKIKSCGSISFVDTKTGEVKLETEYDERIRFDTFQNKKPIGKLKGKISKGSIIEDIEIDIYTVEEKGEKLVINDFIEIENYEKLN